MKTITTLILLCFYAVVPAQERLQYHLIKTDASGNILPWYHPDPGTSYDHIIHLLWNFWDTMRTDHNGLPYYMNHQVWRPGRNDPRGLGGDQLAMALESWRLLYAYSGNERVKENMHFIADYYLSHGLSASTDQWPDLPYPYNTLVYSGYYDGDMILGRGFLQPDKAGAFGLELVKLYQMNAGEYYPNITKDQYLESAIKIANTLAKKIQAGNENASPLPFKVNAKTNALGMLFERQGAGKTDTVFSSYTTNWVGTLELWNELIRLDKGDVMSYQNAFKLLLDWMLDYPVKTNKWGPFFEDIPGWSDTQINAVTFAQFLMNHPALVPEWPKTVKGIFEWVYKELGNDKWKSYGVTPVNEQTAYRVPGNSHTSRQAAAQLQYVSLTDDTSYLRASIRQLNWATYMVDHDGKNRYMQDENWLTDGYGDYVRHYLKAMRFYPELSPGQIRLLSTTSVAQHAFYQGQNKQYFFPAIKDYNGLMLHYTVFDKQGLEQVRLPSKPETVLFNGRAMDLSDTSRFKWENLSSGGLLTIMRDSCNHVSIYTKR